MTLKTAAATLAVTFVAMLALSVTSASADTNGDSYVGGEVLSETLIRPSEPQVAAVRTSAVSNSLAFTGSDVLAISLVGVVAIMAGASLLVIRRRTESA